MKLLRYWVGVGSSGKRGTASGLVAIIIVVLLFCIPGAGAQLESAMISSAARIEYSGISVVVDAKKVVGMNNLSLGAQVAWDCQYWLSNPTRRELAQEVGFKLIRVFEFEYTIPKACQYWNESTKTGQWDWTTFDSWIDGIFSIGAEPLICLGSLESGSPLIPSGMAINPDTGLPYPESFAAYAKEWVKHFAQRGKPVRFWEIFNEPAHYFGYGTSDSTRLRYFISVWNAAARAMRSTKSDLMISFDHITLRQVLDRWLIQGDDIDFIDFHKYDADSLNQHSDTEMFARAETFKFETDTLFYGAVSAQQKWQSVRGKRLPILLTEANFNSYYETGTDPKIQQMAGTVWYSLVLRKSILSGFNCQIYYHYMSSGSSRQTGFGFGMVNLDNDKPWYPYHLHKMLGEKLRVGDAIVESTTSSDDLRSLAWKGNGLLNILLISKVNEMRNVHFSGVSGDFDYSRIDNSVSYASPNVQVGRCSATQPLQTKGYSVVLLSKTI